MAAVYLNRGSTNVSNFLPADVSQARLEQLITELNDSDDVDGILVQLPLPAGLRARTRRP